MLNHNFTRKLFIALRKKVLSKYCLFRSCSSFTEKISSIPELANLNILDLQNVLMKSSIKPYLNIEKIYLLKPFLKTKNDVTCKYNFVIDDTVAKDIVDNILLNNKQKNRIIIEGNPGLGLITNNLLNSGLSSIHVFDNSPIKEVSFAQLLAEHPNKITLHECNMHNNPGNVILNMIEFNQEQSLPMTVLCVATSFYFLRHLVSYFINYHMWKQKFELFCVTNNNVLTALVQNSHHLRFHVRCTFQLLFNVEEVTKYPRNAFLPFCTSSTDDMTLIRVTCNPDFNKMIAEEDLDEYFGLLKILGKRKLNFLIPTLDKWIPDCGPYLIAKGVSMTMLISELSHKETIELFQLLKKCAGYDTFKHCQLLNID